MHEREGASSPHSPDKPVDIITNPVDSESEKRNPDEIPCPGSPPTGLVENHRPKNTESRRIEKLEVVLPGPFPGDPFKNLAHFCFTPRRFLSLSARALLYSSTSSNSSADVSTASCSFSQSLLRLPKTG